MPARLAMILVLLAVARSAGAQAKTAGPSQATAVVGALLDGLTGRPVASRKLRLEDWRKVLAEATTDAEGRFRFEGVRPGSDPMLKVEREGQFWSADDSEGKAVSVRLKNPRRGVVDAGTIVVLDASLAEEAFGAACEAGWSGGAQPKTGHLFFMKKDGKWRHEDRIWAKLAREWTPPWKAVVCVEESSRQVGTYGGSAGGPAFEVTWRARVIRLADGAEFKKSVTADPPPQILSVSIAGWGDPTPKLVAWLKGGGLETIVVEGTLLDEYTGQPLGSHKIRMGGRQAETDAQGRFRLDKVPLAEADAYLVAQAAGGTSYDRVRFPDGGTARMKPSDAKDGLIALGALLFDGGLVDRAFAGVCGGARSSVEPRAKVLFFKKRGEGWTHDSGLQRRLQEKWSVSWKGVVCVDEGVQRVGPLLVSDRPHAVTWKVLLVRLSDDKRFKTKVMAGPAYWSSTKETARGDPMPELVAWVTGGPLR